MSLVKYVSSVKIKLSLDGDSLDRRKTFTAIVFSPGKAAQLFLEPNVFAEGKHFWDA